MTQEFSLDQKKVAILVTLVLVLVLLVFIAGYLSGTLVGLPETEAPPVVLAPPVKTSPKPPVVTMQVPQVEKSPEPEEVAVVAEPEPEPEPEEEAPAEKLYSLQVGAFRTQARAEEQKQQLAAKGYQPYIYPGENSKGILWYTLRIGDFDDVDEAIRAARDFRALESSAVVLTHFDSLMMVRDEDGKRIEIAPPAKITQRAASADDGVASVQVEAPGSEREAEVPPEPEIDADEIDLITAEPETEASEPETEAAEPETVAAEPETVAAEPETVAAEPKTIAEELDSAKENRITFALPAATPSAAADETPNGGSEGVGRLIVAAETYRYAVQVGAFLNGDNAVKFTEKLRGRGYPAYVFHYTDTSGNAWHAVRAGDYKDPDRARAAADDFEEKEQITAIVTRIDSIKMAF